MPGAPTQAGTFTSASSNQLGTVQTAYELMMWYNLRPQLYYDDIATVKATHASYRYATVTFTKAVDLTPATTALTESSDVSVVAPSDSTVSVTLSEYGNAAVETAALRAESFIDIDPVLANLLAFNAAKTVNDIIAAVLIGWSNVVYSGSATSRANLNTGTTTAVANDFRKVTARLRANNAPPFGTSYVAYLHPNVSYDVQVASGSPNWRVPHEYDDPSNIYTGEMGSWGGVRFIETPTAPVLGGISGSQFSGGSYSASGTSGNTAIYVSIVLAQQALCKGFSTAGGYGMDPVFVVGPQTDVLRRFQPLGWKHLVGYALFRPECLYRIESTSALSDTDPLIDES